MGQFQHVHAALMNSQPADPRVRAVSLLLLYTNFVIGLFTHKLWKASKMEKMEIFLKVFTKVIRYNLV